MAYYTHLWLDLDLYEVVEHFDFGGSRIIPHDQHDYLAWVAVPNTPENIAGGRFVTIVDGQVVIDPDRDAILAAEAAAQAIIDADAAQRIIDIQENLPTWLQVVTAINNLGLPINVTNFLLKLTRVVYWLAKNTSV